MLSKLSVGQPSSVRQVVCSREKGQASHLTERISGPNISSESLEDSGRKLENRKLIDYKSPSYPDPNLGHSDKLCANPDVFASGLSKCHPILFSLLLLLLLLHLTPCKTVFIHPK